MMGVHPCVNHEAIRGCCPGGYAGPVATVPADPALVAQLPARLVRARCRGGALGLGPADPPRAGLCRHRPGSVQYGLYTAFVALIATGTVPTIGPITTGLFSIGLPGVGWSEIGALVAGALSVVFVGYS